MATTNVRTVLATAVSFWFAAAPARAACSCGPDFCQDDSRVAAAFASKRQSLQRQGYADRLTRLLDRAPRCVAAAERAPDGFTLLLVMPNGDKSASAWSQAAENLARTNLAAGRLQSYHIMNVRRTFACCQEPDFARRPDYDSKIDLNTGGAINCRKTGSDSGCQ